MAMGGMGASSRLPEILHLFEVHGGVSLQGTNAGAVVRWSKRRGILLGIVLGAAVLGLFAALAGIALRETGVWALLIAFGLLLVFAGVVAAGVVALQSRLLSGRLRAELQPVMIDAQGIALRGIGPLPWSFVAPPERRRVPVKNDIGGDCTVMPLTSQGHAYVNAQPGWWRNLVGPKPYLRSDTPYLLLPGVAGLTEDETLQLFLIAHHRYAR